jgi:hypothetical protein
MSLSSTFPSSWEVVLRSELVGRGYGRSEQDSLLADLGSNGKPAKRLMPAVVSRSRGEKAADRSEHVHINSLIRKC